MSSKVSGVRRGAILIGLALTLVVPLVPLLPGGKDLMRIPGFDSLIGREPFWWALFAVVLLYVLAVERRPLASIGLHKPNWKTFAIGAGASGAIAVFSGVVVYYGLPLLHLHENADALKKLMAVPYWFRFAIVLRAAVVEETLFRGYGIERLRELTGSRFVAGALTLAAFTIAHLSYWGWTQVLIAGSAGLVLTVLYLWRRDLGTNMVAHFVTDAVGLLLH